MSRVTASASGAVASFRSPGKVPVRGLTVNFSPVQSGTGDPSPSNVRPITGWTGVNAYRNDCYIGNDNSSGWVEGYVSNVGTISSANSTYKERTSGFIPVVAGTTYTFDYELNSTPSNSYWGAIGWYKSDKTTFIQRSTDGQVSTYSSLTVTAPSEAAYARISMRTYGVLNSAELRKSADETIPVTFPSEAGTVYGGSVDLVTGTLTVDFAYAVYDGSEDEDWNLESKFYGGNFYIMTPSTWKRDTNSTTLLCNLATSSGSSFNSGNCKVTSTGNFNIYIGGIISVETVSGFREWLSEHNLQVVCKLITPVTYTLTPQQLSTLIGYNNIYSDADSVEVEYDLAESAEMMRVRQRIMSGFKFPSRAIGIFTKGYEATLTPEQQNLFTITHNLGIIPRFVLIEIDDSTRVRTNSYVTNAMIDLSIDGMRNDKTGVAYFEFYYNSATYCVLSLPYEQVSVTETTITLSGYPYGTSRSCWDNDADYIVHVWG